MSEMDRIMNYVDAEDRPMVDGGLYNVSNPGYPLYRWHSNKSMFVKLNDPAYTLGPENCPYAWFIDEDQRVDVNERKLVDGQLYFDDDRRIYRWDAADDQFIRIRPNDKAVISYAESKIMNMEVVF
jgi:hypothetical protein